MHTEFIPSMIGKVIEVRIMEMPEDETRATSVGRLAVFTVNDTGSTYPRLEWEFEQSQSKNWITLNEAARIEIEVHEFL